LDSALARPQNRFLHEPPSDIATLAASYGFGLSQNHPFVDGDKRAAFYAVGLFLSMNGFELIASQVDAIGAMLNLAAGQLAESEFADWVGVHSKRTA